MSLRKWTRADRVALAELIEAYEETGRLLMDPIPCPLDDEIARFNRQAGYAEGEGRNARGIRDQIKRARDGTRGGSVPASVRDSVKRFKTREEKEAYAQAASMFEPNDDDDLRGLKRPHEEAFGENEGDSPEVRALKRQLTEQRRRLAMLEREKESAGLAVFKALRDSVRLLESSPTQEEMMCLALMFFNRHLRFSEQDRTTSLLRVDSVRSFLGEGGPDMSGALAHLGEPFFRRCQGVLSWGGAVFVQFPVTHVSDVGTHFMGPADLREYPLQTRTVSIDPSVSRSGSTSQAVDVTIDASYICFAHKILSAVFAKLIRDPDYSGDVRAAAFDSERLKRNGWTTIIPQSLLVCDIFAPHDASV